MTIVVLIILAVISINAVLGDNGIIRQAEKAREHQANAEAQDNDAMNELDKHLANVIGQDEEDSETLVESPTANYFEYVFDEETKTATIVGGNPEYCVIEEYYNYRLGDKEGIKSIKEGEKEITEIILPSVVENERTFYTVTDIGGGIFCNNTNVTSITIPDSVISIENKAFNYCESLTSVTIGNSVTSIGERTFEGCSGLTNIIIPNSVTSIGDYAFEYCTGLTNVIIPDSVTSVGGSAFEFCRSLTSVTIGNSVTRIGYSAFEYCSSLTSVTIGNSVTSIGASAFRDCSGLISVTIPDSVTSIGLYAFEGTLWDENQPDGEIYVGKVYYKYKGTMPSGTNINIEEGTKGIAGGAFQICSGLTSVTIPDSITSIGVSAFYSCSNLTSVNIPEGVTRIEDYAFAYCKSLTSATIGNSVTSIGSGAFTGCSSLTSIIIPDSVTSIGGDAFSSCTNLTSVTINSAAIASAITSNSWYVAGYLVENATTIYIKDTIAESSIGLYITSNYTKQAESDKTGYIKYIKNT